MRTLLCFLTLVFVIMSSVLGLINAQVVGETPTCFQLGSRESCIRGHVVNCAWCPLTDACVMFNPCNDKYYNHQNKEANCTFAIMGETKISCQEYKYYGSALLSLIIMGIMLCALFALYNVPLGPIISVICGSFCALICLFLIASYIVFVVAWYKIDEALERTATDIIFYSSLSGICASVLFIGLAAIGSFVYTWYRNRGFSVQDDVYSQA